VLIVSPFSEEEGFKKDFGGDNTHFIKWRDPGVSGLMKNALAVPEMMRRLGYFRRFKNKGMMFYLKNQYKSFGENGKDVKFGFFRICLYWILSVLGKQRSLWRVAERFLGSTWYQCPELVAFSKQYDNVVLIKSANWGLQDRVLARVSSDQGWRNVLMPYTTDQLFATGYMLSQYDAVCVQGEFELHHARAFHLIPEASIFRLGSPWFRHMEEIGASANVVQKKSDDVKRIIYAGVSNTYFPSESEFLALDAIIQFIGELEEEYRLIYRPVVFDKKIKRHIENKYGCLQQVEIQWPKASVIGLDQYVEMDQDKSLLEYISDMSGCDLLVISRLTSFSIDVAFQEKCGVISNMIDSGGMLARRHSHLFPTYVFSGVLIAYSIESLMDSVKALLNDREKAASHAAQIISAWDYPEADFERVLVAAVYGEATVERV